MRILISFIAILVSLNLNAQDTITVLQYNLLWYGEITDWCDNSNNNINLKDQYLNTIIDYNQPDIFAVNEMSKSPAIHQHLLDQVLNSNGVGKYQKASFIPEASSDIVNMLYFNTEKLAMHSHYIAQNYIRDIDVYKFYYLSGGLINGDTTFLSCVVAHLKSSSGGDNEEKRRIMANNTMNWLNDFDDNNNYLMMGDFNVYSPSEPAFQEFINYENPTLQFLDPIDQIGEWHNNADYSHVHTQSTHTSGNGCPSTGGMDDRFDFILISKNISEGNKNITYVPDSYLALGQDGEHFNKSLISSPENTSVPATVLDALYNNSDHLPITLKLVMDKSLHIPENDLINIRELKIVSHNDNLLVFQLRTKSNTRLKVELLDISGKVILRKEVEINTGTHQFEMNTSRLNSGVFLLRVTNSKKYSLTEKLIKP